MPKQVNHDERREELARAVWAVVDRAGIAGATVRAVAAQSGWSMGALRYYFKSQSELLGFAVEEMLRRVEGRLRDILASEPAGIDRAQAWLEQMLPLDADRMVEARVFAAFMALARVDTQYDTLRHSTWQGERFICRAAVADVVGGGWPPSETAPLADPDQEADAERLHAMLEGVISMATLMPEIMTADRQRALIRQELERFRGPA